MAGLVALVGVAVAGKNFTAAVDPGGVGASVGLAGLGAVGLVAQMGLVVAGLVGEVAVGAEVGMTVAARTIDP